MSSRLRLPVPKQPKQCMPHSRSSGEAHGKARKHAVPKAGMARHWMGQRKAGRPMRDIERNDDSNRNARRRLVGHAASIALR